MQIGPGGIGGAIIAACPALNDNPAGTTEDDGLVLADQNSSTGLSVGEVLFQVPARDAAPDMAVFAAAPTSCASFTGDLSGLTFNFTTAPLTVAPLGDKTVAMRLTGTTTIDGQQLAIYFDFVVVLHHDTIIVTGISQTPPDINDTETFATDAYTKVAARW